MRSSIRVSADIRRPSPVVQGGPLRRIRDALFNNLHNSVLSVVLLVLCLEAIWGIFHWAVAGAVWHTEDPEVCKQAAGACWAIVGEKYRLILFGTFPYDEQWRPLIAVLLILGLAVVSAFRQLWSRYLVYAWIALVPIVLVLMLGGVFGLKFTDTHLWGGLPLTLIMAVVTVVFGLPWGGFQSCPRSRRFA
jgi:general L-amino acid transport system permease protein